MTETPLGNPDTTVAVVGMAGRFPGASDVATLWRNLVEGTESVRFFTREELAEAGVPATVLDDPDYVRARAVLDDVAGFDAAFFGYSPRDAEIIDPQQRLFLECAWEAVEHAGYDTERYEGHIGVYAGSSTSAYLMNLLTDDHLMQTVGPYRMLLANDKDHLTMRVAHLLDLRGPAVTVQTACSTSLVAVHMACQAVLNHECDMALAGGVTISLPQISGYRYEQDGIMSPDGHCRAFDAAAHGTVAGNGAGVVVLKRLADAIADGDTVHAVLLGSAVNNDGSAKAGYTAPSAAGQAEVIAEALEVAGVAPATVSYIEAHGTGTPLGDPIEISALAKAFRGPAENGPRAIGSVKTNIGHLDTAAGVAGLIKTVLALSHRTLPPSLHFTEPNPKAHLAESGFQVTARTTPWPSLGAPRRAGVSSFGMGGTNAHVVLEEAPRARPGGRARDQHLLTLSAATPTALDTVTGNLARCLAARPDVELSDVAYTLQVGRRTHRHRRVVVCRTTEEAITALAASTGSGVARGTTGREVVFMFPGQGTQRAGMAADLYRDEPFFRELVDRCSAIASPLLGIDLTDAMFAQDEAASRLRDTAVAQPALFTVEYALARLWMRWGVRPDAMIGHSVGEYVAACLAGVFSLEDALRLLVARGRLVQGLPPGAMLSVPLPEVELLAMTGEHVGLAAVNGPRLGVLSGSMDAITAHESTLAARGVPTRRLHTSHAFHSPHLDPVLPDFRRELAGVTLRPPAIPYVTNVTGTWVTDDEATSQEYWTTQLRDTVRFGDGIRELLSDSSPVLLEVGPGETLAALARQGTTTRPDAVVSLPSTAIGGAELTSALGRAWLAGVGIDWHGYHDGGDRRRIPLPTYPFERTRHWVGGTHPTTPERVPSVSHRDEHPEPGSETEQVVAGVWREMLGVERFGVDDTFLELGGHSLLATQITARLRDIFQVQLGVDRFFELQTVSAVATEIENQLISELAKLTDEEIERLSES